MKNTIMLAAAMLLATTAHAQGQAQSHKLTQVWETEASLKVPESVRFDAKRKVLYVSNIDGEPWAADGKGSIAKVGLDGKVLAAEWITGLDCPKGMVLSEDGKALYVADAKGIVVIDIDAGRITKTIAVPGSQRLNDLAGDGKGTLYVSDSGGKKVYAIKGDDVSTVLDEQVLKGPNGLLVHDGKLLVLDNNSLNEAQADKTLKVLAGGMEGGVDGLEHVQGDDFLVSAWGGSLWYVSGADKQLLFDGKAVETRTADIGWDPATRTVYVPTFFKNTVIAFKVD